MATKASQAAERKPALSLPMHLSERKLLLVLTDLLLVNLVLYGVGGLRLGAGWGWSAILPNLGWYALLSLAWTVTAFFMDAYNLRRASRLGMSLPTTAAITLAAGTAYLAIPYLTPPLLSSRLSVGIFLGGLVGATGLIRVLYVLLLPNLRRTVLVVGAGTAGETIARVLQEFASEFVLAGFVDDDPAKAGQRIAGAPILGTAHDLLNLVDTERVTEVIVAIGQLHAVHPALFQAIMDCHERGVQVVPMPVLYEQLTGRVAVEFAGRDLHVVLPLDHVPGRLYRLVKRLFDLLMGVLGLALMLVILPIYALLLQLESKGPIIYAQTRVGRSGRLFRLLKFRTMIPEAEANGAQWAQEKDPRATRVGRILRRLHLDEVPQALNLLRGDLSFIGPRPERPEFAAELERSIPFYRARQAVRPGITGWAQVNYRYGASTEDALVKLQYDLYYIKHQSLWLDLVILGRTLWLVLTLRGR